MTPGLFTKRKKNYTIDKLKTQNALINCSRNKLSNNSGNLKQTWKILNELTNRKTTNYKIHELKDESGEIIEEKLIPHNFSKYFVEIEEKLANNIPQCHISPETYLNDVQYPENGLPGFQEISESDVLMGFPPISLNLQQQ